MSKVISPFVVSVRRRVRDSFTLVEILVVISIIAILAGVALPSITGALKKAGENAAMQSARGLELGCFQFSVDNNQTYPSATDGTSLSFFSQLTNGYVNNPDAFYIAGTSGKTKYTSGVLAANNVCWDVTTLTTSNQGLGSSDPDQTPVIMSQGSSITYGTPGTAAAAQATITAPGTGNPFGTDGIAVAFKGGNAQFYHCQTPGTGFAVSSVSFDPVNSYTQVVP